MNKNYITKLTNKYLYILFLSVLFSTANAQQLYVGDGGVFTLKKDIDFSAGNQVISKHPNGEFHLEAGVTWVTASEFVDGPVIVFGAGTTTVNIGDVQQSPVSITTDGSDEIVCQYFSTTPTGSLATSLTSNGYQLSETEHWSITKNAGVSTDVALSGLNEMIGATYNGVNSSTLILVRFDGVEWVDYSSSPGFGLFAFASSDTDFVSTNISAFLQGAKINPPTGEETVMRDDLRTGNHIPLTTPYTDGVTINSSVLSVSGDNAIVDWIWVELRDAVDNKIIQMGKSALIQRDGDIVETDGVSTLVFDLPSKTYYVALHHRNHLAVMSQNSIALGPTLTNVNFTDNSTTTFGANAQRLLADGSYTMWTGNVDGNNLIQYSGTDPDTPKILSAVLNDPGNFLNFTTYVINGYNVHDINMDGNTQYIGTMPDTPLILENVLAHPGNFLNFSTYQIQEQLPEN
jgi:hypothetical protein